jgi:protein kinase-like protein
MLKTGEQIAGYRIESVIGAGGMGVVYEATQVALERPVALKLLTPGLGSSEDFRARFRREAMLQAALEHPHVVSVYEAGESDEGLYIAMRLVRGTNLKALIEDGSLTPERTLGLLEQAAAALDAAHAAGLVHRDVKPQNILVDDEDQAFLADFGLMKGVGDRGVTLSTHYAGSLDYAAPEQIRGEPYGPSGDLYAFATVLYEALTGTVPFPYDTEAALLYAHLSEEPQPPTALRPDLPAGLDDVLAQGLAKRPEDRPASAAELIDDARRALASQPPLARDRRRFGDTIVEPGVLRAAPSIVVEPERHIPWRAILLAAVVLVALALGGGAVGRVTAGGSDPLLGTATAGPLSLTFPAGDWQPADSAPALPGLPLTGEVALASRRPDAPGTVVAGLAPTAEGRGLLPATLQRELTAAAPARVMRAGTLRGIDYPSLPAGRIPDQLSLFLVPTTRGTVAVACLWPKVMTPGTHAPGCDAVTATFRLHGLQALPLGSTGAYGRAASSALTLLDGERLAGRRQLAAATTPVEQARAAAVLHAAFAQAAAQVAQITPSPTDRPAHAALVAALDRAASAYRALGAAARTHDAHAYAAAARAADASERAVDSAIARLDAN